MTCITIDWNKSESHYQRWNDLTGSIERYMYYIECAKGAEFVRSANKNVELLFGFSPIAILISDRFEYVISQMKENKFLIKLIIDYFE